MTEKAPRKTDTYELIKSPELRFNRTKKNPDTPQDDTGVNRVSKVPRCGFT